MRFSIETPEFFTIMHSPFAKRFPRIFLLVALVFCAPLGACRSRHGFLGIAVNRGEMRCYSGGLEILDLASTDPPRFEGQHVVVYDTAGDLIELSDAACIWTEGP
jgi:hypothetical protein